MGYNLHTPEIHISRYRQYYLVWLLEAPLVVALSRSRTTQSPTVFERIIIEVAFPDFSPSSIIRAQ